MLIDVSIMFVEVDQRSKQKGEEGDRTLQPSPEGLWLLCSGISLRRFFVTLMKNKYKMFKNVFYIFNLIDGLFFNKNINIKLYHRNNTYISSAW